MHEFLKKKLRKSRTYLPVIVSSARVKARHWSSTSRKSFET